MCIICASAKGTRQPSKQEIYEMFCNNPHGAGYMVARNGKVEIHKGFMSFSEFYEAIENEAFTAEDAVVYHFRISTQAGVKPTMTHPFPLSAKLKDMLLLDAECKIGVAHNGVIKLTSDKRDRTYSDTARFITKYLVKLVRSKSDLSNRNILVMIAELTNSKWALLDSSGEITTVGNFIEENGLLFSNYSFHCYYRRPKTIFEQLHT